MAGQKIAVIIGAGPAGLTAALELVRRTDVRPIVIEAADTVGGISRTVNYKGYRMDIGGHRFFSKSDWVMDWWQELLPRDSESSDAGVTITYQTHSRVLAAVGRRTGRSRSRDAAAPAAVAHLFPAPLLRLSPEVQRRARSRNLGALRFARIGASYAWASLFPRRPERSLEDFLINRFGSELYRTFFKAYTEKVWGAPCHEISAECGAQRIKGLSLTARCCTRCARWLLRAAVRRHAHRDQPDRALPLSEARPRPDVGGGGAPGARWRWRGAARPRRRGPAHAAGPRGRGARARARQCGRADAARRLRHLDDAGARTWSAVSSRRRPRPCARSRARCRIAISSPSACWSGR